MKLEWAWHRHLRAPGLPNGAAGRSARSHLVTARCAPAGQEARDEPPLQPQEEPSMKGPASIVRVLAVLVFILATVGVAPVPMTPLGLALWCASTLVP